MQDIMIFDGVNHYYTDIIKAWQNTYTNLPSYYIGTLQAVKSCTVEMEVNGTYELTLTCGLTNPINTDSNYQGQYYKALRPGMLIAVDIPRNTFLNSMFKKYYTKQFFRIYQVSRKLDSVEVHAHHVSYELSWHVPKLSDWTGGQISIDNFFNMYVYGNNGDTGGFSLMRDSGTWASGTLTYQPVSFRKFMGGMQGSIIDQIGGEWEFDNLTATLRKQLGYDAGFTITNGSTLADYDHTATDDNRYNTLVAYARKSDDSLLVEVIADTYGGQWYSTRYSNYRYGTRDFTEDFGDNEPTSADLITKAVAYLNKYRPDVPDASLDAQYVIDPDSAYGGLYTTDNREMLEAVCLGDTVTIQNTDYDNSLTKLRVKKLTYDALNQKNLKIELNQPRMTLADTISGLVISEKNLKEKTTISNQTAQLASAASTLMAGE
jgi:phage minor structural protein